MVFFVIVGGQVKPEIEMPSHATILQLKRKIEEIVKITVSRQTLRYNGNVLENNKAISEFRFGNSATLDLSVQPLTQLRKFPVFVNSDDREFMDIWVKERTLVASLKRKIEKHGGILAKHVNLYHLATKMEDDFPLSAYYIYPGSDVEMTVSIDHT
ncbi:Ubiquitin domain-containing protein [Melia azedarach]|uniref:Ubiquitin domain-containing protein n=1 Tax=Melia azedarach TaxID=155640 RepID=A0ACC1YMI3_MELAZ|nr:Ubiquitin domain-containing protein [Melia azedarach]